MEKWKTVFDLPRLIQSGAFFFGAALVALAVQNLLSPDPVPGEGVLPSFLAGRAAWNALNYTVLLLLGLSVAGRKHAELAAALLGLLLFLWFAGWHVPQLIAHPGDGSTWTAAFETLAIGSAALVAVGRSSSAMAFDAKFMFLPPWVPGVGRLGYGFSLPVFGALHVIYWLAVASVIPAWIPKPLFWTYFTAAAFFVAGVSLVSGVGARLAATWTGVMFLGWVLILHLPHVAADPHDRAERAALFVALAMGGGAWMIAQELTRKPGGAGSLRTSLKPRAGHFN